MTFTEVENTVIKAITLLAKNTKLTEGINIDLLVKHMITIAYQESKFNNKAKNKNSSAAGLYQILKNTQTDIENRILKIENAERSKIYESQYSSYLATAYFCYQLKRYNLDFKKGIIAYNLGSWKNQENTDYSKIHYKYYAELFKSNTNDLAKLGKNYK